MLIDDPSLALIRREPFEVETKSSHNNGAGEPQIPGSKTIIEYYTGGIDWKVQLISMPSFFMRYQRAT
jgi:hypothetical protein